MSESITSEEINGYIEAYDNLNDSIEYPISATIKRNVKNNL